MSSSSDSDDWCSSLESVDGKFGRGRGVNKFVETKKKHKKHSKSSAGSSDSSDESSEENDKKSKKRKRNWNQGKVAEWIHGGYQYEPEYITENNDQMTL